MTGLFVAGAQGSGVSMLAHALAHEETLPLCDDLAEGARRGAAGERLVVRASDRGTEPLHLARLPEILAADGQARAVVVWRQGVDFVNSRRRARPERHFIDHCLTWTRSLAAAQRLHALFPRRVQLVAFHALLDARGQALVPGFRLDGVGFVKFLNGSAQGRTSLAPSRPVVDAARTGWAMGEVEAFARLCGPALRRLGEEVDLAAAARRRPLDLARLFYERGYRVGGAEIAPFAGSAWTVALPPAAQAPQLRLTAVAARGRRRLRLRAQPLAGGFRLEVVEALTRRPLFAATRPAGGGSPDIDALLPAHDGLIEMALVGVAPGPHARVELRLREAELSHA